MACGVAAEATLWATGEVETAATAAAAADNSAAEAVEEELLEVAVGFEALEVAKEGRS